jgi:hypothetical protein
LSPENFPSEETEMSRAEKAAAIAAANKATARAVATFIAIAAEKAAAAAIAATTEEPAVDDWPPDPEDGSEYGPPLTTW